MSALLDFALGTTGTDDDALEAGDLNPRNLVLERTLHGEHSGGVLPTHQGAGFAGEFRASCATDAV
ncbi:MAG TPA: hypothetical protein PKA37_11590, partial [Planctomycetota bacterium]|nr:hypothetical protein [Planctomycetota bacterium]